MSEILDIKQAGAAGPTADTSRGKAQAYLVLIKPRIATLVLIATALSFVITLPDGVLLLDRIWTGLAAILGTGMAAGAANALNQYWEMPYDRLMRRTASRPLPSGQLTQRQALVFGVVIGSAGVLLLALFVNPLSSVLASISLVSYIWIYTPLKRKTALCVFVGAVPGALPVMIGAVAAAGVLTPAAWMLFAIVYFWQLPHFAAIAWIYREDYSNAGYPVMPVVDSGTRLDLHIVTHTVGLLLASLLPTYFRMTGAWYALGAIILGLAFLVVGVQFIMERKDFRARRLLMASVLYLPLLFGLMLLDKVCL
ncbi:MAG: heme o synthase [Planctomycetota bacterium]|jgi:protoheme IX farnesyltransferase